MIRAPFLPLAVALAVVTTPPAAAAFEGIPARGRAPGRTSNAEPRFSPAACGLFRLSDFVPCICR